MSPAFAKGKGRVLTIYVPTRTGFVQRSTGTTNKSLARRMSAMVRALRDERRWSLLEAIRERRLSLGQLFDHYASRTLDGLSAQLSDIDVL